LFADKEHAPTEETMFAFHLRPIGKRFNISIVWRIAGLQSDAAAPPTAHRRMLGVIADPRRNTTAPALT